MNSEKLNISLKKEYSVEKPIASFGKPSAYAKISNHFFRKLSNKLLVKGYLESLNRDLRKMNSRFVAGTYASMIFFTMMLSVIVSVFLLRAYCQIVRA